MMVRLLMVSGVLAALSGCATLTEPECQSADWYEIGHHDGTQGRDAGYIARHFKACEKHGITPQQTPWREGREVGLREFCVPHRAYILGREGRSFPAVCTPKETIAMRPAWDWGHLYWELTTDINESEDYIDELEDKLDEIVDPDDPRLDSYPLYIFSTKMEIRRLERRRAKYSTWPI